MGGAGSPRFLELSFGLFQLLHCLRASLLQVVSGIWYPFEYLLAPARRNDGFFDRKAGCHFRRVCLFQYLLHKLAVSHFLPLSLRLGGRPRRMPLVIDVGLQAA